MSLSAEDEILRLPNETEAEYLTRINAAGVKANVFAGPLLLKIRSDYFRSVMGVPATAVRKHDEAKQKWNADVEQVKAIFNLALYDVIQGGEVSKATKIMAMPYMFTQGRLQ